jgi:hypothetical protein
MPHWLNYYDNRDEVDRRGVEDAQFADELHNRLGAGPLERKLSASPRK